MDNVGVEGYVMYCSLDEVGNDAVLIQVTGEVSYTYQAFWMSALGYCNSHGAPRSANLATVVLYHKQKKEEYS